jgi:hypothetical protein
VWAGRHGAAQRDSVEKSKLAGNMGRNSSILEDIIEMVKVTEVECNSEMQNAEAYL